MAWILKYSLFKILANCVSYSRFVSKLSMPVASSTTPMIEAMSKICTRRIKWNYMSWQRYVVFSYTGSMWQFSSKLTKLILIAKTKLKYIINIDKNSDCNQNK